MTVRKIKTKKKITRKRSNPEWWDKLVGSKKTSIEAGIATIQSSDGVIIVRGNKVAEKFTELNSLLSSRLNNFKIEFEPHNSKKRYILNKPKELSEDEFEDDETTTEGRFEKMRRQAAIRGRSGKR